MPVAARRIAAAAALIALCAPISAAGGAEDAPGPTARASLECGALTTKNGGVADYINIIGPKNCRTARRVAKRANGKKYSAFEFACKKPKRSTVTGSYFYQCQKGKTGLGFRYAGP